MAWLTLVIELNQNATFFRCKSIEGLKGRMLTRIFASRCLVLSKQGFQGRCRAYKHSAYSILSNYQKRLIHWGQRRHAPSPK